MGNKKCPYDCGGSFGQNTEGQRRHYTCTQHLKACKALQDAEIKKGTVSGFKTPYSGPPIKKCPYDCGGSFGQKTEGQRRVYKHHLKACKAFQDAEIKKGTVSGFKTPYSGPPIKKCPYDCGG